MRFFLSLAALTLTPLALAATPAMAQNPQPAPPTNPTVPVAPPNAPSPPPEKIVPPGGSARGGNARGGNLSNQLSRQRGTIHPGDVDPGMTMAPPAHGANTPVLKPPGTSGGNPSVIPK